MSKYRKPQGSYISYMSNMVKEKGGVNLAQGIPGFQPPSELLDLLSNIAHKPVHQYAPGTGNHKLLERMVERYSQYGKFTKKDFLVTNGGTEAVSLLYTYLNKILTKPYAALAFEPVYESYKVLPQIFGDHFISYPLYEDGSIDFEKLEETCENNNVRIIFLNTPGNPLGKVWKKDEINRLIRLTKELNIYLIIDAVYQELYFSDKPYNPINGFDDHTFYVNSFSKLFSITGWRIGYLVASGEHMDEIQSIHDYTGLCVPSVLQETLAEYLTQHNWGEEYVKLLREQLKESYNKLRDGLLGLNFYIPEIEGGFFIWAKLPTPLEDGFDFAMDLYNRQKVAVIPGEHFAENSENYIRLNIARKSEEIDEALKRINSFFR